MTEISGETRRFHAEKMEEIRQQTFIVVPDDDCKHQNGIQDDFEDWRKKKIEDLKIDSADTLESLFGKIVGVYTEAEERRFILTNILEALKRGEQLSSILQKYRDVGVGDVQARPSQATDPATLGEGRAADVGEPQPGRGFRSWIGKKLRKARLWAGERSYEFVTGLLQHLNKLIGDLILMVMNALKGFSMRFGIEIQGGVQTGATGPAFGFAVAITKDLKLDVINTILGALCKLRPQ
jgi:hypothetical protein